MFERWGRTMVRRRWWVIGLAVAFMAFGGIWGYAAREPDPSLPAPPAGDVLVGGLTARTATCRAC